MASAREGLFTACVPEELGGGGHGHPRLLRGGGRRSSTVWGPRPWLLLHVMGALGVRPQPAAVAALGRGAGALPAGADGRLEDHVLRALGAGRRFRPLGACHESGAGRRRLADHRAQDLDHARPDRRLLRAVRAHRRARGSRPSSCRRTPRGFRRVRVVHLFGDVGGDEAEIALDGLYVEPRQVIGEVDRGLAAALYGVLARPRLQLGARGGHRPLGGRDGARLRAEARGLRLADRRVPGRELSTRRVGDGTPRGAPDGAQRLAPAGPRRARHQGTQHDQGLLGPGWPAGGRSGDADPTAPWGFTNELGLTEAWKAPARRQRRRRAPNEIMNRMIVRQLLRGDTDL